MDELSSRDGALTVPLGPIAVQQRPMGLERFSIGQLHSPSSTRRPLLPLGLLLPVLLQHRDVFLGVRRKMGLNVDMAMSSFRNTACKGGKNADRTSSSLYEARVVCVADQEQ